MQRLLAAASSEVGEVEYLINALSNFVANAPKVRGFGPFPKLVDELLVRAGLAEPVGAGR